MAPTIITFIVLLFAMHETLSQSFNPAILQDSRDLPKVDGAFGFLYRTEDGIAHAAKGEPGGIVHGRFTYTDPTGLKVNYNYNAGSSVTPKYNYNEPLSSYEQQERSAAAARTAYRDDRNEAAQAPTYDDDLQQQYEYNQRPRARPVAASSRNRINDNYQY